MGTIYILSPEQFKHWVETHPIKEQKPREDGFWGEMYGVKFYETKEKKDEK